MFLKTCMDKSKLQEEVDIQKTAQVTLSYLRERRLDGVKMSLREAVRRCSNDDVQVQERYSNARPTC